MFSPDAVTFQEFAMRETLPLAVIQNAALEFLRGREDVVVFIQAESRAGGGTLAGFGRGFKCC